MSGQYQESVTDHASLFFDDDQSSKLLTSGTAWLETYCRLYEKRVRKLTETTAAEMYLWPFMPPPAFEETFALRIEEGELYRPAFGESADAQLRLELPSTPNPMVRVRFGVDIAVDLVRKKGSIRALAGNEERSLPGGEIRITLCRDGDEWVVAVEGKLLLRVHATEAALPVSVEVQSGYVMLIMAQSLAPVSSFIFFERPEGERIRAIDRARNHYRFEWGLRAIRVTKPKFSRASCCCVAAFGMTEERHDFRRHLLE